MTIPTRQLNTSYRRITRVAVRVVDGPDTGLCVNIDADADSQKIRGGRNKVNRVVLNDSSVSDEHFELQLRDKGVLIRDLGSTNGIYIYGLRVHEAWIEPKTVFRVGQSALELVSAEPHDVELSPVDTFEGMAGRSEVMRELFARIERIASRSADNKVRILINGETGTGKELVARALHYRSSRAHKPFVAVNCGTLTPSLATATLLGHAKGAFTGADTARPGCFEEADGGTLFLDEIAELPMEVQSSFLRVLQENKVCRVGEFKERSVDVRVICATHQDLETLVKQRQFREDLYFRLSHITIQLPPLRERGDDLIFLAERFLQECTTPGAPQRLSREAEELLRSHHWPGNVRELASVIHTACMIADGPEIKRNDLSIAKSARRARGLLSEDLLHLPHEKMMREVDTIYYTRLQQLCNNNMTKMARIAELSVEGVRQALIRLGLRT